MNITVVINQMIQLFILIGIGVVIGKTKLCQGDFIQKLTQFVLDFTMPAMIVSSVLTASQNQTLHIKDILIATFLLVCVLPIVAYLCVKILPFHNHKGLYMFMIMYPNVGFMGFPLMQSIFGTDAILSTSIINMAFNLSLFTLGIVAIQYGQSERSTFQIKNLLSPGVIASLIAIVCYIIHIQIPYIFVNPITLIGNMTTPLAMIIIGTSLSVYRLKDVLMDYHVYLFVMIIDVIIPLLFYPTIAFFISDSMIQGITLIILSMPVANGAVLFAKSYHQDEFLAAKTVFVSTLLGIVTIPLLIYICL